MKDESKQGDKEIPTRKNPEKVDPITDAEPNSSNPINPKKDDKENNQHKK